MVKELLNPFSSAMFFRGRLMTYNGYFAFYSAGIALIVFICIAVFAVLMKSLSTAILFLISRKRSSPNKEKFKDLLMANHCVNIVLEIFLWIGVIAIAFSILFLQAFRYLSLGPCIALVLGAFFLKFLHSIYTFSQYRNDMRVCEMICKTPWNFMKKHYIIFSLLTILFLAIGVFTPFTTRGCCVCNYCRNEGTAIGGAWISTRMSRSYWGDVPCLPGEPCHVYLTIPNDGTKYMFVNFHIGPNTCTSQAKSANCQPVVYYNQAGSLTKTAITPKQSNWNSPEPRADRDIFHALLKNLQPNTVYEFQIAYQQSGYTSKTYTFRSLPANGEEVVMAVGGDMGTLTMAPDMNKVVASYDPHVALVGGDIAYDNGMIECYVVWDDWLNTWQETMVTTDGHLIPMILAVGNHDVGVNTISGVTVNINEDGPLYSIFFPQHLPSAIAADGTETILREDVPDITERRTYFSHVLSNNVHFLSLDAGYVADFGGTQAAWMNKAMSSRSSFTQYTHYHKPIYSIFGLWDDYGMDQYDLPATHWVPLFDEYVRVSFDNHGHGFKKTHPLKAGVPHPNGTYYLGEGNWGVYSSTSSYFINDTLFELEGSNNHVWIVTANPSNSTYKAVELSGVVIHEFTINH